MKAARLYEVGTALKVEELAEPELKPGGVIVRVLASHVPNFMSGVVSGKLDYYVMPLPFIPGPGAIAVVEAVADDVFGFKLGQKVFCDINIMIQELTVRGAFMYPRHVPNDLLRMIAAGTLNLNAIKTHVFPLDSVNEAVSKAATLRGLEYSIVVPNSNSF